MHVMRIRTDQFAQASRLSFAKVLSIVSAILLISGCGNHQTASPEQLTADVQAQSQKIQNDPSMTPEQKQQAIVKLKVRFGQLPPSALNQAPSSAQNPAPQ